MPGARNFNWVGAANASFSLDGRLGSHDKGFAANCRAGPWHETF